MRTPAVTMCKKFITVAHDSLKTPLKINHVYLKANSTDPMRFNAVTKQRLDSVMEVDLNIKPTDAAINNNSLEVHWEDGEQTCHTLDWLVDNVARTHDVELADRVKPKYWNVETLDEARATVDYNDAINNDDAAAELYRSLAEYGVCFVTDTPPTPASSEALVDRVGGGPFANREYRYSGNNHNIIAETPDRHDKDIAFTQRGLELHTDNPDLVYPAGLISLHAIQPATTGGHNTLTDGFHAADWIARNHPEEYRILTTTRVNHDYHSYYHLSPILEPSPAPAATPIARVRWAEHSRSPWQPGVKQEDMDSWYRAVKLFQDVINRKENKLVRALDRKTLMIADNWRMVHGRTGFSGPRKVVSCYVGRCDWLARARQVGVRV